MSVLIVVDMSLSPEWAEALTSEGWIAVHWSKVGAANAPDPAVMAWALANGYVVFTHDLDFGTALALTHATGPSVVQIRTQKLLPQDSGPVVFAALRQYDAAIANGGLIVIDEMKTRVRVLPF